MMLNRWIMIIAENRLNYWATYLIDTALLIFFLYWDLGVLYVSADVLVFYFCIGIFSWSITEYMFHRWIYHGNTFTLSRKGHDQHHADPSSMIAMPFIVTPLLLLLPQQVLAQFWVLPGLACWMSGWLFGFITYSFFHHSLHHYSLPFSWYKHQRAYHRVHHAKPGKNFGVTSSYLDRLFGTCFKKSPVSIRQAISGRSATGEKCGATILVPSATVDSLNPSVVSLALSLATKESVAEPAQPANEAGYQPG